MEGRLTAPFILSEFEIKSLLTYLLTYSTLAASVSRLDDGFVYIQSIQIALCDTLELITGWVYELVPARDNNAFVGGS